MIPNVDIHSIECYKCGIVFWVPTKWKDHRLEDKESFWCPNGHSQAYVESTSDKLRKQLESEKRIVLQRDQEVSRLLRQCENIRKEAIRKLRKEKKLWKKDKKS